jgi:hypothetical protein
MSRSSGNRRIRLPPPDFAVRPLPRTRQIARAWFRIHPKASKAIYFSLNPSHRFSHPNCPHKILYLAIDEETCLFERFGDYIYDNGHQLPLALWDDTAISTIDVPPFHLCDLSRTATRSSLAVYLAALMNADLAVPQQWGLEIQNHPLQLPAIKFRSRFTDKACLAIFDRAGTSSQLNEKALGPVTTHGAALDWLTKHQVALI